MRTWWKTRVRTACLLLLAATPLAPGAVRATTFCVDTVTELQAALDTASSNGANDTILVVRGEYSSPSSYRGNLRYSSSEPNSLTIEGDWGLLAESCTRLWAPSPAQTTISGEGTVPALHLQLGTTAGPLTVRYLTFAHGSYVGSAGNTAGGLTATVGSPGEAAIYIHNNMFLFNETSGFGGGLNAGTGGRLEVLNNLFAFNHAGSRYGAAALTGGSAGSILSPGVEIYNNTVVYNFNAGASGGPWGGMRIGGLSPTCRVDNNIFWGNEGIDLDISNPVDCSLWNNDIEDIDGTPVANENAMSVFPGWVDLFNFRLAPSSPLVDKGVIRLGNTSIPDYDLDGLPRLVPPAIDLGAYERQSLFSDGFERGSTGAWSSVSP